MKNRFILRLLFVSSVLLFIVSVIGVRVTHANAKDFEKEVWGGLCGPCTSIFSVACGQEESETCSEDPNQPCEGSCPLICPQGAKHEFCLGVWPSSCFEGTVPCNNWKNRDCQWIPAGGDRGICGCVTISTSGWCSRNDC